MYGFNGTSSLLIWTLYSKTNMARQQAFLESVCESQLQSFFFFVNFQAATYLVWKDESERYCPAGTAAVGARNICNFPFLPPAPLKKRRNLVRRRDFSHKKHPDRSGCQEKTPCNGFPGMIS